MPIHDLLKLHLENLSTRETFLFRIRCEECGREYANTPRRFSKAGLAPQAQEKQILFDAIYEQEFQIARQSAVQEATEQLNCCPICKRLVCNHCFMICQDLDMCVSCAAKLQESGVPVLSDAQDSTL